MAGKKRKRVKEADILKTNFFNNPFNEPSIDECIEFILKKDFEKVSIENALILQAILNNLLELQMQKELPEQKEQFKSEQNLWLLILGLFLFTSNLCTIINSPHVFNIIFFGLLNCIIIYKTIDFWRKIRAIKTAEDIQNAIENRNERG